jgi:hypothetical protein
VRRLDGARSRHRCAIGCSSETNHIEGAVHIQVTTIGVDLAKNVFQVPGVDANDKVIVGAFAVLRRARAHPEKYPWVTQLLARKPAKIVAVAIANKTARIA